MSEQYATAFGVYPDRIGIRGALTVLKKEGFSNSEISVLFRECRGVRSTGPATNAKASERGMAGHRASVSIGGAFGWLAGIGPIVVPGQGPFVAAGPIMVALQGAGKDSSIGGVVGALVEMGVPENEAKQYDGRLGSSWILLSVRCTDLKCISKAKQILGETRAENVVSTIDRDADSINLDRSGSSSLNNGPIPRSHIVN